MVSSAACSVWPAGELIILSLVFAFGAPIYVAGTASLLVSAPTVSVGIVRYWRRGSYSDRVAMRDTVLPMALGSVMRSSAGYCWASSPRPR